MNFKKNHLTSIFIVLLFIFSFSSFNPSYTFASSNHVNGEINFGENKVEAKEWGETKYEVWRKQLLTTEEIEAVKNYTSSAYTEINGYLRTASGKLKSSKQYTELNKTILEIDKALKKGRTSESIIVYRRVSERVLGLNEMELRDKEDPNKIIKEKFPAISEKLLGKTKTEYGYLSTSLAKDPSLSFSGLPILMQITLPPGTKAAYLGPLSHFPSEMEMLVARGTTYKIVGTSIIVLAGREYIKIEAKVINK